MTQRVSEIRDFAAFVVEFVTNRGLPRLDVNNNDLTTGVNLGPADGAVVSGEYEYGCYLHTVDLYLWQQPEIKNSSGGSTRLMHPAVYAHDALCRNTGTGWWQPTTYQPEAGGSGSNFDSYGGTVASRLIIGQPNMRTMEQSFYWRQSSGWNEWRCRDTSGVAIDVWPNMGQEFLANGAADGSTAGYWTSQDAGSGSSRWHGIAFEGITDTSEGMPGETDARAGMLRGSSTHPKGLFLARSDRFNIEGSGTPSDTTKETWLWVDSDTGLAVGKLGVLAVASSNDVVDTDWQGPSIDKRQRFLWDNVQFVPDKDSSYSRPKGELHFFLASETKYNDAVTLVTPVNSFATTPSIQYFAVYDFNPFNDTSGVERIHNRQTQLGELVIPHEPIISGGDSLPESSGSRYNHRSSTIFYHPPSESYVSTQASYLAVTNNGTGQPAAGSHRLIRWDRAPTAFAVSIPSADAAVIENGASYFDVFVVNEHSQPASRQTVYFQSFRKSTRAEAFDGTATGAGAYVVDNGIIDEDGSLDVREADNVDSGGTLLVETTDYTVNYGTGTLTPVGSWPTDTIYVRYRHRSVPISPGWGTLSASSAVTGTDGKATITILLPDNLDGELVGLNTNTETAF